MKMRYKYIDIVKGIAIILVIVGHYSANTYIKTIIWSFHMPLFIVVSGFFQNDKSVLEVIKQEGNRLLKPYWITCLAIMLWEVSYFGWKNYFLGESTALGTVVLRRFLSGICCFASNGGVPFRPESIPRIGAIWFLEALFVAKIYYAFLIKIQSKKVQFLLIIMCYSICFLLVNHIWIPMGLHYGVAFLFWLFIGKVAYGNIKLQELCGKKKIFVMAFVVWLFVIWLEYKTGYMHDVSQFKYSLYGVEIVGAIAGIVVTLYIGRLLERDSRFFADFLAFAGRKTIWILCVHALDIEIYEYVLKDFLLTGAVIQIIRMVMDIGIALLLQKIWSELYANIKKNK